MAGRRRRRRRERRAPCCASRPTRPRPTSRPHPRVGSTSKAQVGDTFACGERIGWFLDDGEEPPAARCRSCRRRTPASPAAAAETAAAPVQHAAAATTTTGRIIASPMAKRLAKERGIDLRSCAAPVPVDESSTPTSKVSPATPAAPAPHCRCSGRRIRCAATAAARQLADLLGVDLTAVPADPTDGRVTRDGVAQYVRMLIGTSPGTGAATRMPTAPRRQPGLPPAMQEPDVDHQAQRHARHDRQADARVADARWPS